MCYFAIEDHECACAGQELYNFRDVAFVIDGWALEIALKHYKAFIELAILSRTAICCRVTPSQEAQVLFISS
ncbi:Phospholipid-transporting ATPase 2 [Camellia lanceoleosa]|uniref:Phospholipid-transporting ATPase 2 n=1 Tax=Camellia lanceoleosa TaxID=1840588 RepID=A0ACC0H811_9ERIC|nr:Phospholipid-transporting ATPase 2 [Camellia lanceoleosa]